jgi:hypothetical protein
MRNSDTHPLRIADIAISPTYGKIGIIFAPGKRKPVAMPGVWNRDLATDPAHGGK